MIRFDGLCILPINMVNDKIYITLWFWLVLLLCITASHAVFRAVTVASPRLRLSYLLSSAPGLSPRTQVRK